MKKFCFAIYVSLLFFSYGCGSKLKDSPPQELVFGIIPGADAEAQLNRMNKVVTYLSQKLDMKVRYVKGTDYAAVIEAMKTGKVHIASTGPFSYLIASSQANAEPLVATQYRNGGINYSGSLIFTFPGSGLNSMEDVINRASELTMAFADPASTSGYLYPLAYLRSLGLEPEEDFKEVFFAGGHAPGIYSTISGKVELACTYSIALDRMVARGRITPDQYKILWRSDKIPPTPIFVRKDLPNHIKQGIREAFLNMPAEAPEILALIKEMYGKDLVYTAVSDTLYAELRDLVNQELENLLHQ